MTVDPGQPVEPAQPEEQSLRLAIANALVNAPALPTELPRFGLSLIDVRVDGAEGDPQIGLDIGIEATIACLDLAPGSETPVAATVREVNHAASRFQRQLAAMARRLEKGISARQWDEARRLAGELVRSRARAALLFDEIGDPTTDTCREMDAPEAGPPLLLNVTYFCNAKCPFCMVYDSLNRPELTMEVDEIYASMRQAREDGSVEVGYSGGEPTIHPAFLDFVRYANSLGYVHQQISTNGIRFKSAAFTRETIEAGVSSIDISIHGDDDELHDLLVAKKGALKAIRAACRHFEALRNDAEFFRAHPFVVGASVVVTRENAESLERISRFLTDELGIEHIRLKYAYVANTSRRQALVEQVAPYEDLVPHLKAANEYLSGRKHDFCFTHIPLCLMGDHLVFSKDFEQRTTVMAFHDKYEVGDPSHRNRRDSDMCDACVMRNLCTRLDESYEHYHGRPELQPFTHADVESVFLRAESRWPLRVPQIRATYRGYLENRDIERHEWEMHGEGFAPGAPGEPHEIDEQGESE